MKFKKFKPPKGLVLNYDNLYIFPADNRGYTATYGDTQCNFTESELSEVCEKINSFGCTSFQLSKEELSEILEKLKEYS